jgi:hypothetical protein
MKRRLAQLERPIKPVVQERFNTNLLHTPSLTLADRTDQVPLVVANISQLRSGLLRMTGVIVTGGSQTGSPVGTTSIIMRITDQTQTTIATAPTLSLPNSPIAHLIVCTWRHNQPVGFQAPTMPQLFYLDCQNSVNSDNCGVAFFSASLDGLPVTSNPAGMPGVPFLAPGAATLTVVN